MSSSQHNAPVPFADRLATRQIGPIMLAFVCVFCLLPFAGYILARNDLLEGARHHAAQIATGINRYDAFYRSWMEKNAMPLVHAFEGMGRNIPPGEALHATTFVTRASNMLGQRELVVRFTDVEGKAQARRWLRLEKSWENRAPEESGEQSALIMASILNTINDSPEWHFAPPDADALLHERSSNEFSTDHEGLWLYFSVPLRLRPENGQHPANEENVFGVLTLTVSMNWFENRVRFIHELEDCAVFLLGSNGRWTLPGALADMAFPFPPAAAAPPHDLFSATDRKTLDDLKNDMRLMQPGMKFLDLNNEEFLAIYAPLSIKQCMLGILIPSSRLLDILGTPTMAICVIGFFLLGIAMLSIHSITKSLLSPLSFVGQVAARLAQGDAASPALPARLSSRHEEGEVGRLWRASEQLRQALDRRKHDLALLARTRERLYGELELARQIQISFLPPRLPEAPNIRIHAHLDIARSVGGEVYDCFFVRPDILCCLIGYVPIQGLPSALIMNSIMPLLREQLLSGHSPAQSLQNTNILVKEFPPVGENGEFVCSSVLVALINCMTGHVVLAAANQQSPFLLHAGPLPESGASRSSLLTQLPESGDGPIGSPLPNIFREQNTLLRPGDSLFFCGSRLLELADHNGALFGREAFSALLTGHGGAPDALVKAVRRGAAAHAGVSRLTGFALLAFQWLGRP